MQLDSTRHASNNGLWIGSENKFYTGKHGIISNHGIVVYFTFGVTEMAPFGDQPRAQLSGDISVRFRIRPNKKVFIIPETALR